ncbi:MAG TPA: FHA domain-containing protein, partial [Candidatus Binataceae bacterium]|nr:FHA domain-containing protein [Candidatus Binataceae bacterium]
MASVSGKPPELSIQTPNGKIQHVALERDRYEVGRAESNALCFQDVVGLSRKHLVFERNGANWMVRDLGSTNGTFVNGARLTDGKVLRSKDRVNVGELTIIFNEGTVPSM